MANKKEPVQGKRKLGQKAQLINHEGRISAMEEGPLMYIIQKCRQLEVTAQQQQMHNQQLLNENIALVAMLKNHGVDREEAGTFVQEYFNKKQVEAEATAKKEQADMAAKVEEARKQRLAAAEDETVGEACDAAEDEGEHKGPGE